MYAHTTPRVTRLLLGLSTLASFVLLTGLDTTARAQPQVIRNITQASERLELTVNTSRILTLEKRIPRMVVNNPELVTVTPISATQVQLAARKPGVTQINLWDEDDNVYTVDVLIYGDVRELELALQRLFPESSIKVIRLTNSLVLEGYVEKPESVSPIVRLAEDYAPKIVNNISVGGVQQVLLKVQVMEVSRTKLRSFGHDFALSFDDGYVVSNVSDLLNSFGITTGTPGAATLSGVSYGVVGPDAQFFGFLEALQENKIAKTLANPTLTTVSGRPARFNVGGEIPYLIPQGSGGGGGLTFTVQFKPYGTEVNFVPIVLGNGNIRLEVRPRVSDLDYPNGVPITSTGITVPALRVREVDTGVELKAGQTLALAGLVQTRVEANERGLPYLSDLPYVGAAFRKVEEEVNEIELLILVTPEFADGMDPHEVPMCGPGMETVSPSNCQLYWGGHLEVPSCGPCAPTGCGLNCANYYNDMQPSCAVSSDMGPSYVPTPAGNYNSTGNVEGAYEQWSEPATYDDGTGGMMQSAPQPTEESLPSVPTLQPSQSAPQENAVPQDSSALRSTAPMYQARQPMAYIRQTPQIPTRAQPPVGATSTPGLIGPIGYDTE